MSVRIKARRFDPHLAAEIVTIENSLGVTHEMTIHVTDHETCPACGRPANKKNGTLDVEKTIQEGIAEFEAHEKKLLAHQRKRKK